MPSFSIGTLRATGSAVVEQILRLINRGHAAVADDPGNGETAVQDMAGADFAVARRLLADGASLQFGQGCWRQTQFHGDNLTRGRCARGIKKEAEGVKIALKGAYLNGN